MAGFIGLLWLSFTVSFVSVDARRVEENCMPVDIDVFVDPSEPLGILEKYVISDMISNLADYSEIRVTADGRSCREILARNSSWSEKLSMKCQELDQPLSSDIVLTQIHKTTLNSDVGERYRRAKVGIILLKKDILDINETSFQELILKKIYVVWTNMRPNNADVSQIAADEDHEFQLKADANIDGIIRNISGLICKDSYKKCDNNKVLKRHRTRCSFCSGTCTLTQRKCDNITPDFKCECSQCKYFRPGLKFKSRNVTQLKTTNDDAKFMGMLVGSVLAVVVVIMITAVTVVLARRRKKFCFRKTDTLGVEEEAEQDNETEDTGNETGDGTAADADAAAETDPLTSVNLDLARDAAVFNRPMNRIHN